MLSNGTSLLSGYPWSFWGKPTGSGVETCYSGAQRGAPWNKAPGRDAARSGRGAVEQLGADAGPNGGDAAGTGGGEPPVPQGPPKQLPQRVNHQVDLYGVNHVAHAKRPHNSKNGPRERCLICRLNSQGLVILNQKAGEVTVGHW